MRYIKTFENKKLKTLAEYQLNNIEIISPYIEENTTDNSLYKLRKKANNWYYKIRWYYRKPGYINYCFLINDGPATSRTWIEEDKLITPSTEEIVPSGTEQYAALAAISPEGAIMQSFKVLARLIHRIAEIRWRMSHKVLIALRDWVSKPPLPRDQSEPHPPCPMILSCRSPFQPSGAKS